MKNRKLMYSLLALMVVFAVGATLYKNHKLASVKEQATQTQQVQQVEQVQPIQEVKPQ